MTQYTPAQAREATERSDFSETKAIIVIHSLATQVEELQAQLEAVGAGGVQRLVAETWHEKADRLKKCVDYATSGIELLNHRDALAAHLRTPPEQKPFGWWHEGLTYEESDFYLASESGDVACPNCIPLYTKDTK